MDEARFHVLAIWFQHQTCSARLTLAKIWEALFGRLLHSFALLIESTVCVLFPLP